LIAESCARQGIESGQLTVHADRGGPMIAKSMAFVNEHAKVVHPEH